MIKPIAKPHAAPAWAVTFARLDRPGQRIELAAGGALAVLTFAVYMVGSGRGFGYDAATSFGYAIATPNFLDAFGASLTGPYHVPFAVGTNDHVLVSLLSHAIFSLSGLRAEWLYRVFPALAAAAAVGMLAYGLGRRFGILAGVCAALFMATDPIFVENSRDVRGYGPMILFCLLASLVLAAGVGSRVPRLLYTTLIVLAGASHLFSLLIVPIHIAVVIATDPSQAKRLLPAWAVGLAVGGAINLGTVWATMESGTPLPPLLDPLFPIFLPAYLMGGPSALVYGLWLAVLLLGIVAARRLQLAMAALLATAAVVLVITFVVQPHWLNPRYFLFLVPGVAYLMAAAIQRWMVLAPVLVAGALLSALAQAPTYLQDQFPIRQAAGIIESAHSRGEVACLLAPDNNTVVAYTDDFLLVRQPDQLARCDLVLLPDGYYDAGLKAAAVADFPEHRRLPAILPGWVIWPAGRAAPSSS